MHWFSDFTMSLSPTLTPSLAHAFRYSNLIFSSYFYLFNCNSIMISSTYIVLKNLHIKLKISEQRKKEVRFRHYLSTLLLSVKHYPNYGIVNYGDYSKDYSHCIVWYYNFLLIIFSSCLEVLANPHSTSTLSFD
jgi:hypothetical protein